MIKNIILALLIVVSIIALNILFTNKMVPESRPPIHVTIRIQPAGRFNYIAHQSILEAAEIERLGRLWNKGETWTAKYIEALIRMNTRDSTILDSILPLKPGQKIEFGDEN